MTKNGYICLMACALQFTDRSKYDLWALPQEINHFR